VSEFDNEKQLMIMQLYDYHNIQELVVGMKDVQASKCLKVRFLHFVKLGACFSVQERTTLSVMASLP